ncbi:MAG TPA: hypothetical protein VE954_35585 [Oligoflexus sp.]|nr:hypothetical protein [Oligoflexus sp.]
MIDIHYRKFIPAYSPEVSIPIRDGNNSGFHEVLLWEFALGELEQYIVDVELIFPDIIKFMKYRGTLHSMKLGLSWVGFPNAKIIRLTRKTYEVDPGKSFNTLQTKAIQSACRQSSPAISTLKRIFHNDFSVSF